ncbi:MAG: DMT family transporter [Chloroflexi bacterium]|nr:DMT family transporter [Chloroflexota bacterium]
MTAQLTAILQALLVTLLWSTSWVLIKFGLQGIPPLTFAGLRYFIAFLALAAYALLARRTALSRLGGRDWLWLGVYGFVFYAVTQGAQFLGLQLLPAITFSLLLNFSAPLVALLAIPFIRELPSGIQWLGIGVFLAGVGIYFYPALVPAGPAAGLLVAAVNVLATSAAAVMGRALNHRTHANALTVTAVSMGIGSTALLAAGLALEPWPVLGSAEWLNILWLAVVNTAFAFTLWNHTLRTLTATQSSMINNSMLVQIAILAWLFLGERPGPKEWLGMGVALAGVALVNWPPRVPTPPVGE